MELSPAHKSSPAPEQDLFFRHNGLLTKHDRRKLFKTRIAIAGVGGIGGLLAERLIRCGVGTLHLCDPGTFEPTNSNRQLGCSRRTYGQKKATVIGRLLRDINPDAEIRISTKGIRSQDDADHFIEKADIIVDEMDFGLMNESIFLQRAARRQNKYYLFSSAHAFGALVIIFDPRGITLEEFNGLKDTGNSPGAGPDYSGLVKMLPSYITRKHQLLKSVLAGRHPVPTISPGVGLASVLTAFEIVNLIIKRGPIKTAPNYIYIDFLERSYHA